MLQEDIRLDPPGSRFVIRPNHSLTWQEARVVLAGIAAVGLIILITMITAVVACVAAINAGRAAKR